VALPADARTREQIDWLAEEILEAGGVATVWLATPGSAAQEHAIATTMRTARAAEYQAVIEHGRAAAGGGTAERARAARRLRGRAAPDRPSGLLPPGRAGGGPSRRRRLGRRAGTGRRWRATGTAKF